LPDSGSNLISFRQGGGTAWFGRLDVKKRKKTAYKPFVSYVAGSLIRATCF